MTWEQLEWLVEHVNAAAGNRAFIRNGKEEDYAWLAEIETPDDLNICDGKYAGPAIEL